MSKMDKGIPLSCWSNSNKSPRAVNRKAVDFPRRDVDLLDFTMDRVGTQKYIRCQVSLNGLREDEKIAKGKRKWEIR